MREQGPVEDSQGGWSRGREGRGDKLRFKGKKRTMGEFEAYLQGSGRGEMERSCCFAKDGTREVKERGRA